MLDAPAEEQARMHDRRIHAGAAGEHWLSRSHSDGRQLPDWLRRALITLFLATFIGLLMGALEAGYTGKFASFIGRLIDAWAWALLAPLLLAADKRLPLSDDQLPLRICAHLFMSAPFVLAHVAMEAVAEYPIPEIVWSPFRTSYTIYYYFIGSFVSYCAISGALLTFRYYDRFRNSQLHAVQLEKQLVEAHLHNLRMQLEPHFVANALNAISSEMSVNVPRARQLVEDLGVLLRLSHEYKDRQLIPLMEELAVLEHYLAIQKVRFGERLRVDFRVAPTAKFALVPSFLMQPLAENAVRHGLEQTRAGGTITISAERVDNRLHISVDDDGAGLPPGWSLEGSSGQGLTITRERLAAIYSGGGAHMEIAPRPGGGTSVHISLPYQAEGPQP